MADRLLACGIAAGPLFIGAILAQALTRSGFDLTRHPLSLLSLGDLGWIQASNFVLTGLLSIAGALGLRRALQTGRAATWGPALVGAWGIGLIAGGVFGPDAALGFPPGTPPGNPQSVTWHGTLHSLAFFAGTLSLTVACVVVARRFASQGESLWVAVSLASAVGILALVAIGTSLGIQGAAGAGIAYFAIPLVACGWVSLLASHVSAQATPDGGAHQRRAVA